MPLNAYGWTSEEDEILVELVRPRSLLYNTANDPSTNRKNILAKEAAWCQISQNFVNKPPQECKKHWQSLKSNYVRRRKLGANVPKTKAGLYAKLDEYLKEVDMDSCSEDYNDELVHEAEVTQDEGLNNDEEFEGNNQMDTGDFIETVTIVDSAKIMNAPRTNEKIFKVISKAPKLTAEIKAPVKRRRRRRKSISVSNETIPSKILQQPFIINSYQYQGQQNIAGASVNHRPQLIDSIIEKILKESTNEVDVFFRSMAEAVKKMDPSLVPKVKMEVCNVVAKYEMQSISKK